jgi:hypothetical protein
MKCQDKRSVEGKIEPAGLSPRWQLPVCTAIPTQHIGAHILVAATVELISAGGEEFVILPSLEGGAINGTTMQFHLQSKRETMRKNKRCCSQGKISLNAASLC